jgi:SAM-dependent methyltransferase
LGQDLDVNEFKELIKRLIGTPLPPWEQEYLDYHAFRFRDTLKRLGTGEGKRLLDLGAFPGHLALAVQTMGYQVQALTGRNESGRSLDTFTSRLSRRRIPVVFADVEFEVFPFPDQSFDVVLATEIIEHLPFNPYHMLREAFRVLKPGGRLILSTPNLPKLDNLLRFAFGRSIHPDIRLPFHKTFKSILIGRHIREYTARELIYMLEEQNKETYRFEGTRVSYSMCLDPAFSFAGAIPWLVKRFWPRMRATIFLQSFRPHNLEWLSAWKIPAKGFYEVEEHKADLGSTGRVLATPFRWTGRQAEINLPASQAEYQVFFLPLVFLAPRYLSPAIMSITIGENSLGQVSVPPGREYLPLYLALPNCLAEDGKFTLRLEASTWRPADHAQGLDYFEFSIADTRALGLALGWDGFLREDCVGREELQKTAQRACCRSSLHQGNEPGWSLLRGLYLVQAGMKSSLSMGPGDWRQLGLGWHPLERWEQGWMRWSSQRSEAYLKPAARDSSFQMKVYTGDAGLGEEVKGSVEIDWAPDCLVFFPRMSKSFCLPADRWLDLFIDLPSAVIKGGSVRVTVKVNEPRIPACLLPNSEDKRPLGLAVFGLAIN